MNQLVHCTVLIVTEKWTFYNEKTRQINTLGRMSKQIINILPFLMSALKLRASALEGCFAYKWGTFAPQNNKGDTLWSGYS